MIRILVTNDDCHDNVYRFRDGTYQDVRDLLEELAQPHTETYEIKYLYWLDCDDDNNEGCTLSEVNIFEEFTTDGINQDRYEVLFDILWKSRHCISES